MGEGTVILADGFCPVGKLLAHRNPFDAELEARIIVSNRRAPRGTNSCTTADTSPLRIFSRAMALLINTGSTWIPRR